MANHKSAKKRSRQNVKRNEQNKAYLSKVRTIVKTFQESLKEKKLEASEALLKNVQSALHKAATKGVIKRNNASRRVSRLTRSLRTEFQIKA